MPRFAESQVKSTILVSSKDVVLRECTITSCLIGGLGAAIRQVWLISKEFGSRIVHMFSLLYPSRLAGTVSLGIPFVPPTPSFFGHVPEGFYMSRLKVAGRAEPDFGRFDAKKVVCGMYILFSRPESTIAKEGQELLDMVDSSAPLPSWFSEEDLEYVGGLYEKYGFRTALKVPYM